MALIMKPGQKLKPGHWRTDETHRYRLYMKRNGKLDVYAYLDSGKTKLLWSGGSKTNKKNKVHLYMNKWGYPEVRYNNTNKRRWCWPCRPHFGEAIRPKWKPHKKGKCAAVRGSTLHLEPDGRLVLGYEAKGKFHEVCSSKRMKPALANQHGVIPGALTIEIKTGNKLSDFSDKRIVNESSRVIGVKDDDSYVAVLPGKQVGISTLAGTLAISETYFFPTLAQKGASSDAGVWDVYGPDKNVIKVTGSEDVLALV